MESVAEREHGRSVRPGMNHVLQFRKCDAGGPQDSLLGDQWTCRLPLKWGPCVDTPPAKELN